ncbi:MAG: UDP-3-O-[3-hydroxymyristoyl] N-acetylglucosamine deacetylase [Candidatus Omnitrophica bacterium]|nr:UDP-3-O-[3-hydroxymyristoyl] N-acetylglucosamine deacetylase [Candidatus Omnitrophota bacterium]
MERQRTIQESAVLEGLGLHTGQKVKVELLPAPPNAGIIFIRKDIAPEVMIKADYYSMLDPVKFPRRTSIAHQGVCVHTVEHLMAALNFLGIDNLYINIWGEEVPGMDGSAKLFVESLRNAKIVEQEPSRQYVTVKEPLWVEEGNSSLVIFPAPYMRVSYTLQYNNPLINTEYVDLTLNGTCDESIYQARTFCLQEEVQPLLDMGLGKGSTYENTLVISEKEIVKNKIRVTNEFVKHKVMDLLGDLYLAGPIKGHIIAIKSGHNLNIRLVKKIKEYQKKASSGGIGSIAGYVATEKELSIGEIMKVLPHRYPFLLIDRIISMEPGKRAIGIKNVTVNDYFFQGHFPQRPVMPGVLIIEAMAQVGGVLMLANEENKGKLAYFMAADDVKFRKTVEPGDQLVIEVNCGRIKSKTGTVYTKAFVDNKAVAEATLMFALVDS